MFRWLFGKRQAENSQTQSPPQNRSHTTRMGRRGVCIRCGELKSGSFVDCPLCGYEPVSEEDLAHSLALNEAEQGSNFEHLALSVKLGATPQLSAPDLLKIINVIRSENLERMLGRDSTHYLQQEKMENAVLSAATRAANETCNIAQELSKSVEARTIDFLMLAAATGYSALAGLSHAPRNVASKLYFEKAFPHRFARQMIHNWPSSLNDNQKLQILEALCRSMSYFGEKWRDQLTKGDAEEQELLLAALVFNASEPNSVEYLENAWGFLSQELSRVTHDCSRIKL